MEDSSGNNRHIKYGIFPRNGHDGQVLAHQAISNVVPMSEILSEEKIEVLA
jgi:hypothetical protein